LKSIENQNLMENNLKKGRNLSKKSRISGKSPKRNQNLMENDEKKPKFIKKIKN